MTTKRTNWRTALCSILAVALSALAIEIAAGHVPIPTDAAWAVPIVVPALVALTSKLREEAGEPPTPTFADLPYKVPPSLVRRPAPVIATAPPRPTTSDPRTDYWPETIVDPGAFPTHANAPEATSGPEPPGAEVEP